MKAPSIERVNRNTPTSAIVQFTVPSSEQNADYFEVSYYNLTGPKFVSVSKDNFGHNIIIAMQPRFYKIDVAYQRNT